MDLLNKKEMNDATSTGEPTHMKHILLCNYTGIQVGILDLTMTAGHVPYMSHWNEMVCYHSLFSLSQHALCEHMTKEWARLSKLIAEEEATNVETTNLRVGFVALLHSLGSINRDRGCIGIPDLSTVQTNLQSLVALNKWQAYLASKRFFFPELHISNLNGNAELDRIRDYLNVCWEKKVEYEKNIDDAKELERSRIAERAILAIRDSWIKPTGKKLLWQYCTGYLTGQWASDAAGWMRSIFLSSSATITDWDYDEIEFMEQIIFNEIPGDGNVVAHAIRQRIDEIKRTWKLHYDAYEIEESTQEFINQLKEEHKDEPAPELKDYPSKAAFYVARAKWELAHPPETTTIRNKQIEQARDRFSDSTGI